MVSSILKGTLAAAAALVAAGPAWAGSYHVYSCRTPSGESAPADGWSGSKTGTYTYAEDTCGQPGGALVAALGDQAARTANTDMAGWAFTAPEGEHITSATLWRAGDADGGAAINATYEFWVAAPSEASIFDECLASLGCSQHGNPASPLSAENRLPVPGADLGAHVFLKSSCGGVTEFKCKEGSADPNGYAAVVYLFAADMTLEQPEGPSVSGVSGELSSAPEVAGTSDVAFTGTDPGAGVYEAVFSLDGQVVQSTVVGENGGRCRNVGQTSDGLAAFLYVRPCLPSVNADVGFDTTRFPNGPHHLVVSVIDAAGNGATVMDRTVTIANTPSQTGQPSPPGGGGGSGPANGTNASSQASMTVAWKGAKGPKLVTGFGHVETVLGRLAGPGGVPTGGAQVDLLSTPSYAGARPQTMADPHTRADGSFSVRIPPGASSRTLQFAYRAHLGDPLPVVTRTLTLTVRAGVSLTISPLTASVGRQIFFHGRLLGGFVPPKGALLVLEARSPGGPWIKFDVVRSGRTGRYQAGYRFRFPGPAVYQFRALSVTEGDYPFAGGASNTVVVTET
ncbi:MAG TPA: hypothetical protein VKG62_06865 [Solirubrobacteraceae bacterium]|nr:hypothetical protein [Solirubrobacteraceae bacterium]